MVNINKDMILREIVGENVLVPTGSTMLKYNGLFMLTPTAAFIWAILPEADSEEEIVDRIVKEYDVEREKAQKDVSEFLTNLREHGIID